MKILVIQTAFMGDLILTLPLIQSLKKNLPDSKIDLVCIPYTEEIVRNNPYISEVIIFDKHKKRKISDLKTFAASIKEKRYDIAIIPHRSVRSALIAYLGGIRERIGFKKRLFDFLFSESFEYPYAAHEVDRNLCLLQNFKFKELSRFPELFPDINDELVIDDFLESNKISGKFVCIAPGSKWFTKKWIPDYFASLCRELIKRKFQVILIGGAEDNKLCNYITLRVNNAINICGRLTLLQTANLIKKSSLLVSNDSAPVHIAAATNTPVIDIYGPTVPEIGFYPLSDRSISLQVKDLNCRPCGVHGGRKCPVKSFDCMNNISPALVLETAIRILNEKNN